MESGLISGVKMTGPSCTRGSIWWVSLSKYFGSSVQGGFRPVVIVSSTMGCRSSDVVTVCPLTTKVKDLSVNVSIKPIINGRPQQVLTNQLVTVPKNLLRSPSGYLDEEDLGKVEQGILTSLGILNSAVNREKVSQEALMLTKKDREDLDSLIPQAKDLVNKLSEIIKRSDSVKGDYPGIRRYIKHTEAEITDFIKEWEDVNNDRNEVAKAFGFNSYGSAYNFWLNHKKRV